MGEWIVDGQPEWEVWPLDLRRFGRQYGSQRVHARAHVRGAVAVLRHQVPGRGEEGRAAAARVAGLPAASRARRGLRREGRLGARQLVRVERRRAATSRCGRAAGRARTGRRRSRSRRAPRARRSRCSTSRRSRSSRCSGPGALAFLERLCANRIDRPVGSVVYTQLLNQRGGIEGDLSVMRRDEDRFLLVTGTAFGTHDRRGSSATCRATDPST